MRAVLVRAQGKNFCTGAELGEVKSLRSHHAGLTHSIDHGHAVLCALEESRLPVVAAVQGLCLTGGLELILACDLVFAAQTARFGDQHGQFGLVPGWGGTPYSPVRPSRAKAVVKTLPPMRTGHRRTAHKAARACRCAVLLLSGRRVSAAEALRIGLVNRVCSAETLAAETLAYATDVAMNCSPRSMRVLKQQAYEAPFQTLAEAVMMANEDMLVTNASSDFKEGYRAFLEKRRPNFVER